MTVFTLAEAQRRLPDLLTAAAAGEDIVITRTQHGAFRLVPFSPSVTRPRPTATGIPKAGRLRGQLVVPDNFDAPLEELSEYME